MDRISETKPKDAVGILVFTKDDDVLVAVVMQRNGDAWSYFGGEKQEGEPDIVAAQRWMRAQLGIDLPTEALVPFARTQDSHGRCGFFATALSDRPPASIWALSQVGKYSSEMALDVPVMIEMAKLALTFPDDIFFTVDMK